MKIVDLNVLLYAVNESSVHHRPAVSCWESLINGDETVALPWVVLSGFLRVATNPRVFPHPLDVERACTMVDEWLALEIVFIPTEKPAHWVALRALLVAAGTAANLTTDAHIAAIAITHDATVVSFDRDFRRFDGLRVKNPLD